MVDMRAQHRAERDFCVLFFCEYKKILNFVPLLVCLEYFPFTSICPEVTSGLHLWLQNYPFLAQL